ncbi:DUF2946 family protein [Phenylobacterium kunshanense]|uniref:DUF2946 domain-containing protein n=1 Tax=Phenylobacterium kunshanense TaxID=1445034 RepID=A0A328BKL2_9CAUL|nr:DUF2946 family protein [Phenylobacterium kunshanense]RAK67205.1 hypothetical protein DJ019_04515 [Phenylobacterium kunshanense]
MIALCAAFILLVQMLAPAFAASGPRLPDGSLLICADGGMAPSGAPTPADDGDHSCDHCVCPASAIAPAPTATVQRVAYSAQAADPATPPRFLTPPARAPPRPPGQGPPSSDA